VAHLLFVLSQFALLSLAVAGAYRFVPSPLSRWERPLAGMLTGIVAAYGITLVCGAAGVLRPPVVGIVSMVLALPSLPRFFRWVGGGVEIGNTWRAFLAWLRRERLAVPALALVLPAIAWWFLRNVTRPIYFSQDDRTYHASNTVYWLEQGKITVAPFTYQGYFPLGGEVVAAWFCLPFEHEAAAYLTGVLYAVLLGLCFLHIAKLLGKPFASGLVTLGLVLATGKVLATSVVFADIDLGMPTLVLASLSLVAGAVGAGLPRAELLARGVLAGAAAGYTVGMKLNSGPSLAIGILVLVFCVARRRKESGGGWPAALGLGATMGGMATLFGGFWLVRNFLLTGNPVYPTELGPFSGPMTSKDSDIVRLSMENFQALPDNERTQLVTGVLDWPWPMLALSIVGFFVLLNWAFFRKGTPSASPVLLCLTVPAAIMLALFPSMPFSLRNELLWIESTGRYLILPYLVGMVGIGAVLSGAKWSGRPLGRVFLVLCAGAILAVLALAQTKAGGLVLIAGFVTVLAGAYLLGRSSGELALPRFLAIVPRGAAVLLGMLVALAGVVTMEKATSSKRKATWVARGLAGLPDESRIGFYNEGLFFGYDLYGERRRLKPVRLTPEGKIRALAHHRTERHEDLTFWDTVSPRLPSDVHGDDFLGNLQTSAIDCVITSRADNGGTPTGQELLLLQLLEDGKVKIRQQTDEGIHWDILR